MVPKLVIMTTLNVVLKYLNTIKSAKESTKEWIVYSKFKIKEQNNNIINYQHRK
jgi:hypothetical protein